MNIKTTTWYISNEVEINSLIDDIIEKTYGLNIPRHVQYNFYINEEQLRVSLLEYIYNSSA
jgi:hypothetical protein